MGVDVFMMGLRAVCCGNSEVGSVGEGHGDDWEGFGRIILGRLGGRWLGMVLMDRTR